MVFSIRRDFYIGPVLILMKHHLLNYIKLTTF